MSHRHVSAILLGHPAPVHTFPCSSVAFTPIVPSRVAAYVPSIHTRRSSGALISLLGNIMGESERLQHLDVFAPKSKSAVKWNLVYWLSWLHSSSSRWLRLVTLETQHERDADKYACISCENEKLKVALIPKQISSDASPPKIVPPSESQ